MTDDLMAALEYLCEDSLEVPLSHVDGIADFGPYPVSERFKIVRDGIVRLRAEVERLTLPNIARDQLRMTLYAHPRPAADG